MFNLIFGSIGLAVFFSIFYLLANNKKIPVTKSTIIALLLGVIVGSAFLLLLNIFLGHLLPRLVSKHGYRFFRLGGFSVFPSQL